MAYSRDSSGSGWCRRKKFRRHWSHVRMPRIFIGCFIDQAQLDSHDGRIQWEICLARRKISNMFDFFLTASRGQFLTKSSPHTVRKRLSKPPREAVCSALSSPCAAGFRPPVRCSLSKALMINSIYEWVLLLSFLAFWLVLSISVISSYTVWPYMGTDCLKCCQAGKWLALRWLKPVSTHPSGALFKRSAPRCIMY